MTALDRLAQIVTSTAGSAPALRIGGTVQEVSPTSYRVAGLERVAQLGDLLQLDAGNAEYLGEVIRIERNGVIAKAFDTSAVVGVGSRAWHRGPLKLKPHEQWRGRVVDALAGPIDDLGPMQQGPVARMADASPPNAMQRRRINTPVKTGVRVIDLFTPLCMGQRLGIFAGSGVGKSTLLGMLARSLQFDSVVIALVGERGREVREFIEALDPAVRARTTTVVSTGDQSPMLRRLAPRTAMTIAEYYRDLGNNVLLIMDSVTRYAHAARDAALASGEPPVSRGYPPSVFSDLPRLLERAGPGTDAQGTITALFAVLIDGDDHNDPVADSIRGTLDGHVVLDRAIAEQGRYPAVDPLKSISRLADLAWKPEQKEAVLKLRRMISQFEETRDLRMLGGYQSGTDPDLDIAIAMTPKLIDALRQRPDQPASTDAFAEVARALQS